MAKVKSNKRVLVIEGFVSQLDEWEDNNIALFPQPTIANAYGYNDTPLIDFNSYFQQFLGKKIKLIIKVVEE